MNSFDPPAINPVSGTPGVVTFAGVNGVPERAFATDTNNFGPRVGFAYRLPGQARDRDPRRRRHLLRTDGQQHHRRRRVAGLFDLRQLCGVAGRIAERAAPARRLPRRQPPAADRRIRRRCPGPDAQHRRSASSIPNRWRPFRISTTSTCSAKSRAGCWWRSDTWQHQPPPDGQRSQPESGGAATHGSRAMRRRAVPFRNSATSPGSILRSAIPPITAASCARKNASAAASPSWRTTRSPSSSTMWNRPMNTASRAATWTPTIAGSIRA